MARNVQLFLCATNRGGEGAQEVRMNHVSELRMRERRLRARVSGTLTGDRGVSEEDREWIAAELGEMEMLLERHLAEIPSAQRQYERYRLEFELPLFSYMSRTYELFCALSARA